VRRGIRALVEDVLPWFDRQAADAHDAHTEAIRQRSIRARQRAEVERARLAWAVRRTAQAIQEHR
jgi:hypothetical protein